MILIYTNVYVQRYVLLLYVARIFHLKNQTHQHRYHMRILHSQLTILSLKNNSEKKKLIEFFFPSDTTYVAPSHVRNSWRWNLIPSEAKFNFNYFFQLNCALVFGLGLQFRISYAQLMNQAAFNGSGFQHLRFCWWEYHNAFSNT